MTLLADLKNSIRKVKSTQKYRDSIEKLSRKSKEKYRKIHLSKKITIFCRFCINKLKLFMGFFNK